MEKLEKLNDNVQTAINEITEHKPTEKERRQYQFMEESGHGAIFFKSLKSQYIMVNNKTLDIFGLSREQIIGKDDYQIFSNKREARKNIEEDKIIFETGKPKEVTRRMTGAHGKKHWYHFIKLPQFDDKGDIIGLVGIIRDITERKNTEKGHAKIIEAEKKKAEELKKAYRDLQESKDALVRSEKLAYTGRIAASIAHEIRNPLTNVSMSAQRLKKICKSSGLHDIGIRHLDIVEKNTDRINYLITELLNCARPPKLNLKPFDIHKVIRNALESTRSKIRSQGIEVVKKFIFRPPKIMLDREQMERAFLNMVLNAIEAMPHKGILTIVTQLDKDLLVVKIQDTGKGIHDRDIIRIFDPFYSSKPNGVGLGLTLCYGIIVSHGGTIEVESKLRKGTLFTISLPLGQNREGEGHTYLT